MKTAISARAFLLGCILFFQCGSPESSQGQDKPAHTNALINETSPYLLQHAHNPVNWFPWGTKALDKASQEKKLLIISVGYAACHWCHVMEEESFEDTTVSRLMNDHFVSIKVDREERPDVDDVYMTACQMISDKSCGWPLNAIALPDGKPVWAGTYFPKNEWLRILRYFIEVYQDEPEKLAEYAENVAKGIQSTGMLPAGKPQNAFTGDELERINQDFLSRVDMEKGGRRGAPKFPVSDNYRYLMQVSAEDGFPGAAEAVRTTLNEMAKGGIYDHVGGGFARYSTDADWHIPHFEKMLYDNAQLVSLYAKAYKWSGEEGYLEIVRETVDFLEREMKSPEGAFYSSLDADSEGEEGKFYVWTKSEMKDILGTGIEAQAFMEYYDILDGGNWEHGKNVLRVQHPLEEIAERYQIPPDKAIEKFSEMRTRLLKSRSERVRPALDDKILTAWNALMITGLIDAFGATQDEKYRDQAIKTGRFLKEHMISKDGRVSRNFKDGKVTINGFLDDYAFTVESFINLYQATFDEGWLYLAKKLTDYTRTHFLDSISQMFYYTSDLDPALIARRMDTGDNVIPGSNSTMAHNLYRLGLYFYDQVYLDQSKAMLSRMLPEILETRQPQFYSNWCRLILDHVYPPYEIAIVGSEAGNLRDTFLSGYEPQKILLGGSNEGTLELLKEKLQEGKTLIYVCQDKVCKYPVDNVPEAIKLME